MQKLLDLYNVDGLRWKKLFIIPFWIKEMRVKQYAAVGSVISVQKLLRSAIQRKLRDLASHVAGSLDFLFDNESVFDSIDGIFSLKIENMDQTPAPFKYISVRTYALRGCKTGCAKAERSGWDKRQATIQLTVLADGTILKPWVMFRGKGQLRDSELSQYDHSVTVKFMDEASANE